MRESLPTRPCSTPTSRNRGRRLLGSRGPRGWVAASREQCRSLWEPAPCSFLVSSPERRRLVASRQGGGRACGRFAVDAKAVVLSPGGSRGTQRGERAELARCEVPGRVCWATPAIGSTCPEGFGLHPSVPSCVCDVGVTSDPNLESLGRAGPTAPEPRGCQAETGKEKKSSSGERRGDRHKPTLGTEEADKPCGGQVLSRGAPCPFRPVGQLRSRLQPGPGGRPPLSAPSGR